MARFIANEMSLDEIIGSLSKRARSSNGLFTLRNWLKRLLDILESRGQRLNIIITDHTGNNFPWELLELDDDQYLGARARVVRWIPANTDSGTLKIHVHQETRQGIGISFIDAGLGGATREQEALADAGATPMPTMAELKRRLRESVEGIAVVHLACHGTFTYRAEHLSDTRKTALVKSDTTERISVLQLEGIPEHASERPLFIVNACHSARLRKDGDGLFGLAEVLLTRCADAYIGALGPVNTDYAANIGSRLAHAIHANVGLDAAEFLRKWRDHAVAEYRSHRNDSDSTRYAVKFVYAFMYVYFGNPFALWSLNQRIHTEPDQEAV